MVKNFINAKEIPFKVTDRYVFNAIPYSISTFLQKRNKKF